MSNHMITVKEFGPFRRRIMELTMPKDFAENWFPICDVELGQLPERQQVILTRIGDEVLMQILTIPGNPWITLFDNDVKMIEKFHDIIWEDHPELSLKE